MNEREIDLLTYHDLLALPPTGWLMKGLIPDEGYTVLYGQPSNGKSFVALDWAMCISQGLPWLGLYPTRQAPAIYIAAEGGRGIQKRARAWAQLHTLDDLLGMYFLINPVYMREEGAVEGFLQDLEDRDIFPGLIVLDTLSRSFGSGDENASTDMGHFVDAVMRLADGRSMAVLVVHHTNAAGAKERGHSSLRGAAQAMFHCEAELNGDRRIVRLKVTNDKQKDDVSVGSVFMEPNPEVTGSLVFQAADPPPPKERGSGDPKAPDQASMVAVLAQHPNGLTHKEWLLASRVPERTFNRRLKTLIRTNVIYKEGGRYLVEPALEDLVDLESEA